MIIAEFSIIPIGTKTPSVSKYVKAVLKELEKDGRIRVKPEVMGTIIETENLEDLFKAVKKAHNSIFGLGVKRIVTEIKIDDRRDKKATIESKIRALR
ncbi:MAG: MTH1187 family thiamine-binding protein [Candidatus Altiarchaeota archaeon]|nr:MTH1187 family thiamine-binding protein [Candidatus Altiarchaeota archaeon]